jgi:hypothetical protein
MSPGGNETPETWDVKRNSMKRQRPLISGENKKERKLEGISKRRHVFLHLHSKISFRLPLPSPTQETTGIPSVPTGVRGKIHEVGDQKFFRLL